MRAFLWGSRVLFSAAGRLGPEDGNVSTILPYCTHVGARMEGILHVLVGATGLLLAVLDSISLRALQPLLAKGP